ncbi:MAG TPA: tetratricopeptide repeat protein, partial [Kofleriaceae bacterium]
LARSSDREVELDRSPDADPNVTQAGALIGTLRYMAPEQLERRTGDERSDQFAFCIALWEALGDDPFGKFDSTSDNAANAVKRRDAIIGGPVRRRLRGVPSRITRALTRGLVADPAARWPSMTALLDHLDVSRRRGRVATVAAVVVIAGVATAATWQLREPAADPCSGVADPIDQAWRASDRVRLAAAFAASGRPGAAELAQRTAAALDTRVAAWKTMRIESCRATARRDQSTDIDRHRSRCLDVRLAELDAFTDALLHQPTAEMVDAAVRAANGLGSVASCGNVSALAEHVPQPSDALLRGRARALDAAIARATTQEALGAKDIAARLASLEQQAIALGWAPAIAAVQLSIGHDTWVRGESELAVAKLREAALSATRAKDDELAARALTLEIEALVDADRPAEGLEVARAAELALARADDPPLLVANEISSVAFAQGALSKFDDSDRSYARAVSILERSVGDQFALASTLQSWSNQLFDRSDYARGLELSNRVVPMIRTLEGEHHPDYARVLSSNGNLLEAIGRTEDAKARIEQALAIKQEIYGPNDPTVATTVHSLGNVYLSLDDHERARQLYQRAYEIYSTKLGPDHHLTLMARYSLAMALRHAHQPREALAVAEAVLAHRKAAKTPQPAKVANTLDLISGIHHDLGDNARALDYARQALAIREQVLGPKTGDVADSLTTVAVYSAEAGNCAAARPAAQRALTILHDMPDGEQDASGPPSLALAMCAKRGEAVAAYRHVIDVLAHTKQYEEVRGRAELALAD